MNREFKKGIASAVVIILLLSAGFVTADYFALFGTSKRVELEFAEARFRTIDKDTGTLIFGAGVRCFQTNNNNACTLRESHRAGVVAVHVPYRHIIESSLLFTQDETIERAADPKIHMMFIHNDYLNTTKSLYLDDLFNKPGQEYQVEMPARDWGNSGSQQS